MTSYYVMDVTVGGGGAFGIGIGTGTSGVAGSGPNEFYFKRRLLYNRNFIFTTPFKSSKLCFMNIKATGNNYHLENADTF